ncbi:MAG: cyclopropane-fatty-acyl-phospholipid synthase family protein [Phenylobacterium sp.]|uniref:SAM-dependent methyltransferase n=1 Tax=Phenylobacterium sp. TaxID=1871053 RepID=UPI002723A140|nr:cyclopropane-fatty-acyl-phospholipid synthase family protein [Phenylobacterium sp.]MDO8914289.1 cyclopropane-fatty-acyl-phospholipid synthase family protein [Phenylobacterium sp.]MDP3102915.1 cyclopropane-fatty-acyl-phospholipid synthase family protein [Phenylobacterium sp.]MDP3869534.1 cyclopropane-fatty-acyl-phospholipid synthase family protein [Phenylobacterium sp.]
MSLVASTINAFEGAPLPDLVRRAAVDFLVANARRNLAGAPADAEATFALEMAQRPIAEHTGEANDQHYELPAAFFEAVLGPQLKYSCCLYGDGAATLEQAEEKALAETAAHADLRDGQHILELGCGWGSLSLWMARNLPGARVTSVSNSRSQGEFIRRRAAAQGLTNLTVITADMNDFAAAQGAFDRIVSVEMFEHMANWRGLLTRAKGWLKPDGAMFIHVFTHRTTPYRFDVNDEADWIGQHFFTGGVMPSHDLMRQFPDLFTVEADWRWSGAHYETTANQWLENYDRNAAVIRPVLREVYGDQAVLWRRRWRLFFLATAGLFGHRGGAEWGVSHYRLRPA